MPLSAGDLAAAGAAPRAAADVISPQSRRHNELRREALRLNPAMRDLSGPVAWSALVLPLLIGLHWGTAWLVSDAPIWVIFLAAFGPGQIFIHGFGAMLHETTHRLVFPRGWRKHCFDLLLEVGMTSYSRQLIYQHDHVTGHHPHLGDYERDYEIEDVCAIQSRRVLRASNPRHQRLATLLTLAIHALPFGPAIGDMVVPRINAWLSGFPPKDPQRNPHATRPPRWQVRLYIATSLASNLVVYLLFGPWAVLYQVWSISLFASKLAIWNLGQSLSEHDGDDTVDPTRSHYGWINLLIFNTGYHKEHHTFPNVAWSRLPALKKSAPEMFRHVSAKGYLANWWDHVKADFGTTRRSALQAVDNTERCSGPGPSVTEAAARPRPRP